MDNYRVAICDDSKEHVDIIYNMINLISEKHRLNLTLYTFTSGKELVADHERRNFDIIFLDMEMPEQNGIETGLVIRSVSKDTKIIYVTAHSGYAYESYMVKVEDYLLKPLDYIKLEQNILLCCDSLKKKKERKFLDINDVSRNFQRIFIDNIICLERHRDRKIHIKCIYKKTIIVNETISNLEKNLADCKNIVKASQSVLINLNNVRKITKDIITFCDDSTVKISESRLAIVKKEFHNTL